MPQGFFKGDKLETFLSEGFEKFGSGDHFSNLRNELFIGATEQSSFQHRVFDKSHGEQAKISEAVIASCALPPFFLPKKIAHSTYIDGQITKSSDMELLIKNDARLIIVQNPLRPYASYAAESSIASHSLNNSLQSIKALVSTRFDSSFDKLRSHYPDRDFVVFEPNDETGTMMAGSPMKLSFQKKNHFCSL